MRIRGDLDFAFGSVKGPVRSDNQDDFLVYEPESQDALQRDGRVVAIADGMGGGPAGGEASRVALRAFLSAYLDGPELEPAARLTAAFHATCDAVAAEARQNTALLGMGTTLTAVVIHGGVVHGIHVGDSRCLIVTAGGTRWLTSLHLGGASDHRLTRAVVAGQPADDPESFMGELGPGERLLLMTDGLWRAVPEADCLAALSGRSLQDGLSHLLETAQRRDGSDNATVVLVERPRAPGGSREVHQVEAEVRPEPARYGTRDRRLARLWPWLLLLLGAALGVLALLARLPA